MEVEVRRTPDEIIDSIRDRITRDVTEALQSVTTLGDRFIVNDTVWYGRSGNKVKPRVVNTADFISRRFETYLKEQRNWDRQKKLEGQTIDAYIEVPSQPGFIIDRADIIRFLEDYLGDHPSKQLDTVAILFYQMYVKRSCFGIGAVEEKYRRYFRRATATDPLRVGLEFETGNIASSFRSLNKLGFLYRRGLIDAGVFITSRDKATAAARIWPASNRNGSFEELERRQYRDSVFLPTWELGFAPDAINPHAPYLGKEGTYTLSNSGKVEKIGGLRYEVWKGGGKRLLRPQPST